MASRAGRRPTCKNLMELKEESYKSIVNTVDKLSSQWPDDLLQLLSEDPDEESIPKQILNSLELLREEMKMLMCDHETDYFMGIANLAALRSKDPWTPVGACIVNPEKKVVGIGYNAMPHTPFRDNDQTFPWTKSSQDKKENKKTYVCHAAQNAIVNRTIPNLDGCTMYVTLHPDEECAHLIVQSGIKEVLYNEVLSSERIENLKQLSSTTTGIEEVVNDENLSSDERIQKLQGSIGDRKLKKFKTARDILRLGRVSLRKCKPKITIELTKCEHKQKPDHEYLVTEHFFTKSSALQEDHKIYHKKYEEPVISGIKCLKKGSGFDSTPTKFFIIREDAKVLTLESGSPNMQPLTLQQRLLSSIVQDKSVNPDLVISWDEFFMGLALLEKKFINLNTYDKFPTLKQGTCIVTSSRQILAIGGSGPSPGVNPDATEENVGKNNGDSYVCHAEYNAITSYKGVISLKGSTLYVTLSPCNVCAKLIAQAGVVEVVYLNKLDDKTYPFEITKTIFDNCNIKLRQMYTGFDVKIDVQVM